eukprot:15463140-Alexandrium_andersonii.AAC.1
MCFLGGGPAGSSHPDRPRRKRQEAEGNCRKQCPTACCAVALLPLRISFDEMWRRSSRGPGYQQQPL